MKKLKEYWLIVLLVLIVLAVPFYWYSLRPSQIIKECNKWKEVNKWNDAVERRMLVKVPDEDQIAICLAAHGLKK